MAIDFEIPAEAKALRERVELLRMHPDDWYLVRNAKGQQGVVPVSRLQAWQAFIAQLDQVLLQQQKQLEQAEKVFEARRSEWQQAWERKRGMEKYIETCRQQEQRVRDLKEQKLADEAAGRAFARRQR